MANEARSAELAITSLISNQPECNNCFIKFLKLQKFEIRAKKARKSERNRKKLDEGVMLCNTLWSDRRRLITKFRLITNFLPFRVLLNVGIDPNFPQKSFFFLFWLYSENFVFRRNIFSLATLSAIIYHIRDRSFFTR